MENSGWMQEMILPEADKTKIPLPKTERGILFIML